MCAVGMSLRRRLSDALILGIVFSCTDSVATLQVRMDSSLHAIGQCCVGHMIPAAEAAGVHFVSKHGVVCPSIAKGSTSNASALLWWGVHPFAQRDHQHLCLS